jgi:hypothetical protein
MDRPGTLWDAARSLRTSARLGAASQFIGCSAASTVSPYALFAEALGPRRSLGLFAPGAETRNQWTSCWSALTYAAIPAFAAGFSVASPVGAEVKRDPGGWRPCADYDRAWRQGVRAPLVIVPDTAGLPKDDGRSCGGRPENRSGRCRCGTRKVPLDALTACAPRAADGGGTTGCTRRSDPSWDRLLVCVARLRTAGRVLARRFDVGSPPPGQKRRLSGAGGEISAVARAAVRLRVPVSGGAGGGGELPFGGGGAGWMAAARHPSHRAAAAGIAAEAWNWSGPGLGLAAGRAGRRRNRFRRGGDPFPATAFAFGAGRFGGTAKRLSTNPVRVAGKRPDASRMSARGHGAIRLGRCLGRMAARRCRWRGASGTVVGGFVDHSRSAGSHADRGLKDQRRPPPASRYAGYVILRQMASIGRCRERFSPAGSALLIWTRDARVTILRCEPHSHGPAIRQHRLTRLAIGPIFSQLK